MSDEPGFTAGGAAVRRIFSDRCHAGPLVFGFSLLQFLLRCFYFAY